MKGISKSIHSVVLQSPAVAVLLLLGFQFPGCKDQSISNAINVSMKNTETYEFALVGGDEDGGGLPDKPHIMR
jgi:hypothetical protein